MSDKWHDSPEWLAIRQAHVDAPGGCRGISLTSCQCGHLQRSARAFPKNADAALAALREQLAEAQREAVGLLTQNTETWNRAIAAERELAALKAQGACETLKAALYPFAEIPLASAFGGPLVSIRAEYADGSGWLVRPAGALATARRALEGKC